MVGDLADATAEAAQLALRMGSAAADTISLVADLGEELPLLQPVLKTLKAIREKVEIARNNPEELGTLHQRCEHITACFIVKCRQGSSELDVAPLEDCVKAVGKAVDRCSRRGKVSRILKASSDKDEILRLKERIGDLEGDLSLAGIATLERMGRSQAATQREIMAKQDTIIGGLSKPPAKLAKVPKGTPAHKSWHVERRNVMEAVLEALAGDGGARLVGLVGASGSGKTTAAAEVVRSPEVLETFSDGILWLSVNYGAKERLPSLMLQLARTVHEDFGGGVGRRPTAAEDGAAYIKQCVEKGHGGEGLKCLVVADNVWDKEVVSKLLETGMLVLLSTRDEGLVTGALGEAVGVDELSQTDAEAVLRRAAELSPGVRLPDDAVDLIELCGRVAMDVAFVGRWSIIRGRKDRTAWSDAAGKVRAAMENVKSESVGNRVDVFITKRRKAILQAGFEDLATGSDDDERVQRLYLSLAVLPDGHVFTVKDAAVLLYDRTPCLDDEASVGGVVGVLERWSIISSVEGTYHMHDAHSSFARERLMDRGDVRRPAVKRWVRSISSLEALRAIDGYDVKGLWLAVERVGGDGWVENRPYVEALDALGESDPLLRESIEAVANFQQAQEDWEGASSTWRRLLEVEEKDLGLDHPYVLNTYHSLAGCADRLGADEDAAEWREKELAGLPLALAKIQEQLGGGGLEGFDGAGLISVASIMLRLTPDDSGEAEKLLRRCLAIKEAKLGPEDLGLTMTLHQLGVCVRATGRLEEAEELLRRSLGILEAKPGREDVEVAYTLHRLGDWARETGRLEEAEELLGRCLTIEESKLGQEDEKVATTLHSLGVCVRKRGRLEEAEKLLMRCLSIKEAKLGRDHVQVAYTLHQLGVCARLAGRLEEAGGLLRRCLVIEESKLGREDVPVAITLLELGVCVRDAGRMDEAEGLLRRCLTTQEAQLGRDHEGVAYTLLELGVCVRVAGRLEEADELLRRCLAIKESKLGPEDVVVAHTLRELGICVRHAGRLEEAEELLRRCLAIQEAKLGPDDVAVARTLHELAVWVRESGGMAEAEELLRRCLAIEESKLGPDDVVVARTLSQLGVCIRKRGRLEEAEELLRRCLRIEEAKLGPEDVAVAYTLHNLGVCVRISGRLKEAEELLRRCLAIEESKLGQEHVQVAVTLHNLGVCVREAGQLDQAEELLRRCLKIREAALGSEHMEVAYALYNLGACVREAGRLAEAEELLRSCLAIEEATLGRDSVRLASTLNLLCVCLQEAGRLEGAEELMRRRLAIEEATLGREDLRVGNTLYELGLWTQQAGRLKEAEELFRRCLRIEEAQLGLEDVQVTYTLKELGVCVRRAGRLDEAEELFRRCLGIQEAELGPDDVWVANTLFELGACLREGGRPEEAVLSLKSCLEIRETKLGRGSEDVDATLHELGICLREAGQQREADDLLRTYTQG